MTNLISYRNGRGGMPTLLGWGPSRLVDDLLSWNPFGGETIWSSLPIQVGSDDDHVYASVDLPGVDPKDVDLTFERGTLSISGQRGGQTYRYSVGLGDEIDPSSIEAELDKGVLMVSAARRPETRPRRIALKGAQAQPKTLESGESK